MSTLTRPDQIAAYRLATLVQGLKLECKGLHKRGKSCYSILKKEHGFKGNKEKVLELATAKLDEVRAEVQAENARLAK